MAKKLPQPKYIRPETIRLGDLIRATWSLGSVEHSRVAVVARREYEGADRVLYAADGQEIFRWHPSHKGPRVTLLAEAPQQPAEALFSWDDFIHTRIA